MMGQSITPAVSRYRRGWAPQIITLLCPVRTQRSTIEQKPIITVMCPIRTKKMNDRTKQNITWLCPVRTEKATIGQNKTVPYSVSLEQKEQQQDKTNRAQERCESRGGRPGLPSLIILRFLWT